MINLWLKLFCSISSKQLNRTHLHGKKVNLGFQYALAAAAYGLYQLWKVETWRSRRSIIQLKKMRWKNWDKARYFIFNPRPPQASLLSQDLQHATKSYGTPFPVGMPNRRTFKIDCLHYRKHLSLLNCLQCATCCMVTTKYYASMFSWIWVEQELKEMQQSHITQAFISLSTAMRSSSTVCEDSDCFHSALIWTNTHIFFVNIHYQIQ